MFFTTAPSGKYTGALANAKKLLPSLKNLYGCETVLKTKEYSSASEALKAV
jgi:hypothetical protein